MGCASSAQHVHDPSAATADDDRKISLNSNGYAVVCRTSIGAYSHTGKDDRCLSTLTVKSGMVKQQAKPSVLQEVQNVELGEVTAPNRNTDMPRVDSTKVAEKVDGNSSSEDAATEHQTKRDSGEARSSSELWKSLPHKVISSTKYTSLSVPTSPLTAARMQQTNEMNGRSSALEMHRNNASVDATQAILHKALRELSRSLSGNHGSTFHVDFDNNNASSSAKSGSASGQLIPLQNTDDKSRSSPANPNDHVVVLDIGSGFCKAGFASDETPTVVIPMVVGRPRAEDALPGVSMETMFFGKDAKLRRDALNFSRPVKDGIVVNWDELEAIVDHTLKMELKAEEQNLSVVMPVSAATRDEREKLVKMMFEKIGVSNLYLGSNAPMALHAFGMGSGLVVSLGHDVTSCVPVYQGNVLKNGIRYLKVGGSKITDQLKALMLEEEKSNYRHNDDDIARAMMERLCYVINEESDDNPHGSKDERSYSLPSGQAVNLDKERFMAPEILFQPNLQEGTRGEKGLHLICSESIDACEGVTGNCDVAQDICRNIVIVGGPSLLPGLPHRLQSELRHLRQSMKPDQIHVQALPKRQYAVWRGAGHMTSLGLSKGRWMSKQEYDEHGAEIVHRKYV